MICTVLLTLTACVPGAGDLFDSLTGKDTELRVLRNQPVLLESTKRFDLEQPALLTGSNAGVCLVLAHEVQFSDTPRLAREYLRGAVMHGELVTDAGQRVPLSGITSNWQSRGVLGKRHELSVCVRPCDALPAAGTRIRQISIATSKPVQSLGIFWQAAPLLKERQARKSSNGDAPLLPDADQNGCRPAAS